MKQKKLWTLVLAVMLAFSLVLVGCGKTTTEKYSVIFAGENIAIATQEVASGKTATKPADPKREGYTFDGWYLNGEAYNFTEKVTSDIALIAKWTKTTQEDEETIGYTGTGTQVDPLHILAADGMDKLAELVKGGQSVYAVLDADVTLAEGFAPIGSVNVPFSGSFDGNGYVIDGLNSTATVAGGLFGATRNAKITDFTVKGQISGSNYAGVVASAEDGTVITLVCSEVTIDAGVSGGIVGVANGNVTVEYCTVSGTVVGTTVGGIAGSLSGASVIECVSTANVSGKIAGGVVGEKKVDAVVYHCYSHGNVTATQSLGAVVGSAETTILQPSWNVIQSFFNGDAVIAGQDDFGTALSVNYYGATGAFDIATDIAWTPQYWNTTGAIPVLEAQDITVPETVIITLSGAQVDGQTSVTQDYHTGFASVPDAQAGKVFVGWYFDALYENAYVQGLPLIADTTLYAAFVDTAIYQRNWGGATGAIDLTGSDYTLYGAQLTSDYMLMNQAVILYQKGGAYYGASIDAYEGTLTWKTSADGITWAETATFMADYSRFIGVWKYASDYGDMILKVCEDLDEEGCLVLDWQDMLWDGAHTRVTEDGDVVLYAGWNIEWFFNEEGVLSYDYGYEIHEYFVAESVYAGEWLSLNGEVIVIDDTAKTITLDGVSASYTAKAGEYGAVLEFALDGVNYFFRYDSVKACYASESDTEECIPYVYDAFVGSWTTGDLAHTYVIDSELKLTVDGVQTVMDPSIVNYELIYSYTLDGKSYQLKLLGDIFLEVKEVGGTSGAYLFNDETKEMFVGSYTDYVNEYTIDDSYQITRTTKRTASDDIVENAQGGFELLKFEGDVYGISYAFEMDDTLYLAMFIAVEPCKILQFYDYNGGDDQQILYGYDTTDVVPLLSAYQLSEDVWSTGGQNPLKVTVSTTGNVTVDGKEINYMLSFDATLNELSLIFMDPANESEDVLVLYEACAAYGTLYLTKRTVPAKEGVTVSEEDMVKEYTLIPNAEIAKFVGTWVYESDEGVEYVIYNADGTCQISTSVTQEDGSEKVELCDYNDSGDIMFSMGANLLDPTLSMCYLSFRAGKYIPELGDLYINVARFGQDVNYVSIMAINYTRSDVYPFVGLFQGEDNTKIEISEKAGISVNGEAASNVVFARQDDGSVIATFKIGAVFAPLGGVGHPEYEFRAVMSKDAEPPAKIVLTNLTLESTVTYTKFTVPMTDIEGSWEHGDEVIKFEIRQVGAKSTLYVSVDGIEAPSISYEFDADGNLVYVFTVNYNEYRVILVKDFLGTKTLRVTCTYTKKQDIPLPPPPPPLPPLL